MTVRYPTCVDTITLRRQNIKLVIFLNSVKYSSQKFTNVRLIRVMLVFLCRNIFSKQVTDHEKFWVCCVEEKIG